MTHLRSRGAEIGPDADIGCVESQETQTKPIKVKVIVRCISWAILAHYHLRSRGA